MPTTAATLTALPARRIKPVHTTRSATVEYSAMWISAGTPWIVRRFKPGQPLDASGMPASYRNEDEARRVAAAWIATGDWNAK